MKRKEVEEFFDIAMDRKEFIKSMGMDLPNNIPTVIREILNKCIEKMYIDIRSNVIDTFSVRFTDSEFNIIRDFFNSVVGSKFQSFQKEESRKFILATTPASVTESLFSAFKEVVNDGELDGQNTLSNLKDILNEIVGQKGMNPNQNINPNEESAFQMDGLDLSSLENIPAKELSDLLDSVTKGLKDMLGLDENEEEK